MDLSASTALVTGANRGLGRQFALALLARGATVYAGARDPASVDLPGATVLRLDVTDPSAVTAAAAAAGDVDLLVNNAGSSTGASLLTGSLDDVRLEMETHYFGTLLMTRAFAPVITRNGGGAVLNVLSALSWLSYPQVGAYCAAKSAAWSLTNGLRVELADAGVRVSSLHVGYMDTDMAAGVDAPKSDPADVARFALDQVAAGVPEILADEVSAAVLAGLSAGVAGLYPGSPEVPGDPTGNGPSVQGDVPVLAEHATRTLRVAAAATLLVLVAFVIPLGTGARTAAALGVGTGLAPWLLSAMALGLAVSLLPTGALGDEVGRRRVLTGGLLVLAAGALLCATAVAAPVFVAGRLVTGLGGGAVLACALGVIAHAFPPGPARGRATGVWGASVGAGIAVGGLVSAAVDPGLRWRGSYAVLGLVAVGLAAAARALLVESRAADRRRPDTLGAGLLGGGLACLLAALVEGRDGVSGPVLGLALAAVVLLAAFVAQEARTAQPLIDLGLFRSRQFLAATTGALASGAGATALAALTPTLVQGGLGRSLVTASLLVLLFAGSSVVTALQVKRLPPRLTSRHLLVLGLVGVAVGQLLQTGLDATSSPLVLVPGTLVVGVAFGVLNATVGREAVASVPPSRAAMGSGANNTARYVGSALGISLVSVVLAGSSPVGSPAGVVAGWNTAALLTAALSLVGAAVIAGLRPSAPG